MLRQLDPACDHRFRDDGEQVRINRTTERHETIRRLYTCVRCGGGMRSEPVIRPLAAPVRVARTPEEVARMRTALYGE